MSFARRATTASAPATALSSSAACRSRQSLHDERLRSADDQHFYDVITNGFGAMYAHGDRVRPRDRWAIVAYVRALQLSQHAAVADLPPDVRNADDHGENAMTQIAQAGLDRRRLSALLACAVGPVDRPESGVCELSCRMDRGQRHPDRRIGGLVHGLSGARRLDP